MSDKVVHSRSPSPAVDSNEKQEQHKKRRKALSCNECRRRKLKCDRTYPTCTRCQKSGDNELCLYETTPNEVSSASDQIPAANTEHLASTNCIPSNNASSRHGRRPHHPSHHPTWHKHKGRDDVDEETLFQHRRARQEKVILLENRIASLEGMLARQTDVPRTALLRPKGDTRTNETYFRGKGFRTQYYGPSNSSGLFPRFKELKEFMKESSLTDDTLRRIKKDYGDFLSLYEKRDPNVMAGNDSDLFRLLPSRQVTEHAVNIYMNSLESIYCILHKPSFWVEYEDFWNEPENSENRRPGFAALLLLILATANCAATEGPFSIVGYSSPARQQAIHWVEASEAWLNRHSQKHLTVTVLQTHCLLLIAKVVNSIKSKRIWTLTGNTLRFSMSVGLHLDPGRLADKISIFNQEMRRRLWATMMELELQACINRGMPSCLEFSQLDCAAPANIHDSELTEDVCALPASYDHKTFTDASFLHVARQSLFLRIQLIALINCPVSRLSAEEILGFEDKITDLLSGIPSWPSTEIESEKSLCVRTMLDIQLRQFLLLLHTQLDNRGQSQSRSDYSRMVCLNNAYKILDQYQELSSKGNSLLLLYTGDVLRVAASLCHNILLSNTSSSVLLADVSKSAEEYVEKALAMLEEKAVRLGTGFMQCWFIISAFAFAQPGVATDKDVRQKQLRYTVDRNVKIYERVLTLQVKPPGWNDPLTNGSTVLDTPASAQNNSNEVALIADDLVMDQDSIGADLGFDLADFSGWTFNDWVAAPWLPPALDK